MCLVVTFYGVLDDHTSDMTLEFGDVAIFRCQMNLDRNPSPWVCLHSGTWGWEAPPGRGWPGARPLLECPPTPTAHAPHPCSGVQWWTPWAALSQRAEGLATDFLWLLFYLNLKLNPSPVNIFLPAKMDGWICRVTPDFMVKEIQQQRNT